MATCRIGGEGKYGRGEARGEKVKQRNCRVEAGKRGRQKEGEERERGMGRKGEPPGNGQERYGMRRRSLRSEASVRRWYKEREEVHTQANRRGQQERRESNRIRPSYRGLRRARKGVRDPGEGCGPSLPSVRERVGRVEVQKEVGAGENGDEGAEEVGELRVGGVSLLTSEEEGRATHDVDRLVVHLEDRSQASEVGGVEPPVPCADERVVPLPGLELVEGE